MHNNARMNQTNAINSALNSFDTDFVKALTEPVRIEILKQLIAHGESDVKSLAENLPQDRSVISRHCSLMEKAGLLRMKKEGRHVIYSFDGEASLHKAERLVETFRRCLQQGCC